MVEAETRSTSSTRSKGPLPITSLGNLTKELREARDPSHAMSIISRAITNSIFINSLGEGSLEELNSTVRWVGSLKTKVMGFFNPR